MTIVGSSEGTGNTRSLVQKNIDTARNRDVERDYTRLKILYNTILSNFELPMNSYISAAFDDFRNSNIMSEGNLIDTALKINNDEIFYMTQTSELDSLFKYEKDSALVENYRNISNKLVDTLKQAITEYIKVKHLEEQNAELLTFKEILQDREKLLQYISDNQSTSFLFSASATFTQDLDIKPWYAAYLDEYGPPGDGVFESEKMAIIVNQLIATNVITEDEYLIL
jgi:hypothetical protein